MYVFDQVAALRAQILCWKSEGLKVGFVPTMGNLHDGHLSLVKLLQAQCDRVVVSIFVNPMQFGPDEDFDQYPRTFDADKAKLTTVAADALFFPSVHEMYPNGIDQTRVSVPDALTGLLEGASRPGHFDGVSTVVCKLFNMVLPDVAAFGQKDYQQLCVIERMVADLCLPIKIVAAPIGRDIDGLALSSRNQYLSDTQRAIAPKLNTVLKDIAAALESGNRNFNDLSESSVERLLQEGFTGVDYIQICHPKSLLPASAEDQTFVILAVARLGNTRLLDNILLN